MFVHTRITLSCRIVRHGGFLGDHVGNDWEDVRFRRSKIYFIHASRSGRIQLRLIPASIIFYQSLATQTTSPTTYKHCEYQSFCFWHVHGLWHTNGPFQPIPPHWPQRACWLPPVGVAEAEVVLLVVVVVETGGLVVVTVVKVVDDEAGGLPVAAAARTEETELHAGFLL